MGKLSVLAASLAVGGRFVASLRKGATRVAANETQAETEGEGVGSSHEVSNIQRKSNDDVLGSLILQSVLGRAGVRNDGQMAGMMLEDQRNLAIVESSQRLSLPVSKLQGQNNLDLANTAYQWYLRESTAPLVSNYQQSLVSSEAQFKVRASNGDQMDCLAVGQVDGKYIGAYHRMNGHDLFRLMVVESSDLKTWRNPRQLHDRASMGRWYRAWGGILLVYEANRAGHGPEVAACFYESVSSFLAAAPCKNHFFARKSLSGNAEGTPHVLKIEGPSPSQSTITIGFHFYAGGINDRQGLGVLRNFGSWQARHNALVSRWLPQIGFPGKHGGRETFTWNGKQWMVLEAQKQLNNWASWRVLLGDGVGFLEVHLRTSRGSTSFANPSIMNLAGSRLVGTIFMPTEGNAPQDVGEFLSTFAA